MKRIWLGVALLTATSTVLVGCSDSDSGGSHEVTTVGTGQVRGAPDILNADIGVEVTAAQVADAVAGANSKAKAMLDALSSDGVAAADVRTADVSIQPEYTSSGPDGGMRRVTGYRADNTVRITVRDLTKASKILDDGVKAGGNDVRLNGVTFAIDDNSKLLADARARAFEDARKRAQQYASLAGLSLGKVLTVSESASGDEQPAMKASPAPESTYVLSPGSQTVTFTVHTKWAMH